MRYALLALILTPLNALAFAVSGGTIPTTCANNTGSIDITPLTGTPPYTYLWADGPTTEDRTGLAAGNYSVLVTDDLGATGSWSGTVANGNLFVQTTFAGGFACPGESNGSFVVVQSMFNGTPPYNVSVYVNGAPASPGGTTGDGDPIYYGLASGDQFYVSASDAGGCSGMHEDMMQGPSGEPITVSNIVAACNGPNGSVVLNNSDWPANVSIRNDQGQVVYQYDQVSSELVTGLASGDYTFDQAWTWQITTSCTEGLTGAFTIPDLGPLCGNVHGTSWYDLDADCERDGGEVGVPYSVLQIEPGVQYALTNGAGNFSFNIVDGAYTLEQLDPTLIRYCPVVQPVPFTVNASDPSIDFANGSDVPLDLALFTAQGPARPGFTYGFNGTVRNTTPQVSGPVTVTADFDPALVFLDASPTPTDVAGNTITWNLGALTSFAQTSFHAAFTVPASTPLGTVLISSVNASNTLNESSTLNNATNLQTTVVGSYDPNDKVASTSSGSSSTLYFIDEDEWIDYTIRFQNTGTAEAIDVVVTDTLPAEFDMSSFEQGAASHAFDVAFKPGRVVQWTFGNINLPDSNANEALSHGAVAFRIRPRLPLLPGTIIENIANIYFDFNDPVITEPSVLVAEVSTGVEVGVTTALTIAPIPTTDHLNFRSDGQIEIIVVLAHDGREVMRRSVRASFGSIDVSGLKSGAYVLLASMSDGATCRGRFIKQ
ncbi:MAG: SprB repeat-containing protein [Flavobacteriales bacterium]|nr:SprB repeat-containing protein [Flavobacteriales bacterium]